MVTIAVDAMGGDRSYQVTVPAALELLASEPDVKLVLVGDNALLQAEVTASSAKLPQYLRGRLQDQLPERLQLQHASQRIEMDDSPTKIIRSKRDSSMHRALDLVASGQAHACISAGNTGALVALSCLKLRTIDGIDRPALISCVPTLNPTQGVHILDLGATIAHSAHNLVQLAVMGSVLLTEVYGITHPKVALLNIGTEEIKGSDEIKEAARQLAQMPQLCHYLGFIEGDAIFRGETQLVVCNGFIGNVLLKTLEGSMYLLKGLIKQSMQQSLKTRLMTYLAAPLLLRMRRTLDPAQHNGASLLGLNGVVIKSHGGANKEAFFCALKKAVYEARRDVPDKIRARLTQIARAEKI